LNQATPEEIKQSKLKNNLSFNIPKIKEEEEEEKSLAQSSP
jgi:hypothetical protein